MCCKSSLEHNQQSPANLPRTVDVCETEVNLDNLFESEGLLINIRKYSWRKNNLGISKINRKYRKNCPKHTKQWIQGN